LPELTNPAVIKDKYPNSDEIEILRDRVKYLASEVLATSVPPLPFSPETQAFIGVRHRGGILSGDALDPEKQSLDLL
jgi:hypothetical protein